MQAIRGATSWPPRVPTYIATTTPMSPVRSTFPIIDGAITSMDPTSAALPWIQVSACIACTHPCMHTWAAYICL